MDESILGALRGAFSSTIAVVASISIVHKVDRKDAVRILLAVVVFWAVPNIFKPSIYFLDPIALLFVTTLRVLLLSCLGRFLFSLPWVRACAMGVWALFFSAVAEVLLRLSY